MAKPYLQCGAPTATGKPCTRWPGGPSGLCLWHDPDRVEEAKEARRRGAIKGGQLRHWRSQLAKRPKRKPSTSAQVRTELLAIQAKVRELRAEGLPVSMPDLITDAIDALAAQARVDLADVDIDQLLAIHEKLRLYESIERLVRKLSQRRPPAHPSE